MTTFKAISAQVTVGRPLTLPPNGALACLTVLLPSLTHSTHCWPTAADRRQSGHAGRPQRTHETYVSRSGCRKHVGAEAETSDPALWPGGTAIVLAARPRRPVVDGSAVASDHHRLEHHVIHWPVVPAGPHPADRLDNLAARDHLAEDRVLAGQPRSRHGGDEE